MTFTPTKEQDRSTVFCKAKNNADLGYKNSSVTLNVRCKRLYSQNTCSAPRLQRFAHINESPKREYIPKGIAPFFDVGSSCASTRPLLFGQIFIDWNKCWIKNCNWSLYVGQASGNYLTC